jgi:S-DNA-T family DNA segregation ATPase FtsK/SpoIIIE
LTAREPATASPRVKRKRASKGARGETRQRLREAPAILCIGFCIFFAAALATYSVSYHNGTTGENVCGWVGYVLAKSCILLFGSTIYIPLAFAVVWSVIWFLRGAVDWPLVKILGVAVLTVSMAVLLEHRMPYGAVPGDARGGLLGAALAPILASGFGALGTYVLLAVVAAIAFTMATDFAFVPLIREALTGLKKAGGEFKDRAEAMRDLLNPDSGKKVKDKGLTGVKENGFTMPSITAATAPPPAPKPAPAPIPEFEPIEIPRPEVKELTDGVRKRVKEDEKEKEKEKPKVAVPAVPYKLPESRLLDEAKRGKLGDLTDETRLLAQQIEGVLASFSVEVRVVGVSRGPAVTMFELEMGEGVTVNTLTARRHDLAIRLKSGGVRFVYPIPGKSTVGVEVPNTKREFVRLRELVEEVPPQKVKAAVPLYLGRDVMNRAVVEDLSEMPHVLIAGQTGSGKSACLNAILCSVLLAREPDEVKLILVDPKHVEFSKYEGIPHLMCPIVTIARKVPIVLDWVIAEMEERYQWLALAGVRKISDFNGLTRKELKERYGSNFDPEKTPLRLPYLVVLVDELNDLMVQNKKDMEDRITRIAQKSRAVGIHLILATQRPSVNVITGTIKANLPTRIAFQTAQGNDSRVILDQIGAEDLLGKGDFLYKPPGTDKFVRAQGTWVGDEEVERLVKHAKSLAEPSYDIRLVQIKDTEEVDEDGDDGLDESAEGSFKGGWEDALFERAVVETLESNRAAASHLQRAFAIGYNRATRILDAMASLGIVSQYEGSKVRRIMITKEEWAARRDEILAGGGVKGSGDVKSKKGLDADA